MGSTMMEEEEEEQQRQQQQSLEEEPGGGLQLAIATTYSVAQTDDFVIKQEPQELLPEMMASDMMDVHDNQEYGNEEAMEDELSQAFSEEVSDVILQRAVSPPTYMDPSEEHLEKLMLLYKKQYQLKDVTVELESCDKIWETLQLIKNIQGFSNDEDNEYISPKISSINQPKLPGPFIPYQPILGNDNKALPDFRFSVKSKKKLYHCITCGKEFIDSQHLRQHAINDHGVYVNPKRVYKPRVDLIPKSIPVISDFNKNKITEKIEMENIAASVTTVMQAAETVQSLHLPQTENNENSSINNLNTEESQVKVINSKEKIKCVLCKRVCTDIVYHMKGYHKVGCISSIIDQCEKVTTEYFTDETAMKSIEPDLNEIDMNETLVVAVKKRKRNTPRWTVPKKKFKSLNGVIKTTSKGPFKCNVCLGFYKSYKSFSHHRRVHRRRGETPQNFNPSNCRFLNSPFHNLKSNNSASDPITKHTNEHNFSKSQPTITDYLTVQKEITQLQKQNEELLAPQDLNSGVDNGDESERTMCDCGRSFRNYHTMYLHKVKCKGINIKSSDKLNLQNINDADSGIGISIKIKKNKNDSYEVVPRTTPIEESCKDSRSSKDSDASSNDSGMVSVDYNNQKADSVDLSKYSKGHSILRIQVAEDDEEVDIEDGDSEHSNLNEDNLNDAISIGNQLQNNSEDNSMIADNKSIEQTPNRAVRSATRKQNIVPSLINLCKQVLAKSKEQDIQISSHKCQTCSKYFKTKAELIEHTTEMKHNTKSHCPCGKKFKNLKYFNIHVRRFHPLLLKCSYCMTNFDKIEKYTEHKCEVTEGKTFIEPIIQTQCLECKDLVDIGEPFDKHMKSHNTDETNLYQCFKCELKFDNSHQRRSHFSKEHGFSLCRICGKLLHIDYISKHEAYHDGLGHPCHICKKAFTQKILLKKHLQCIHDPLVNEVVKCIVCSKSMKLRNLKKHMSMHLHTEICKKCNKCYRTDEQQNLEHHIANNHPDDYPVLKCEYCNMSFYSDKRYQEHCNENSCKADTKTALRIVQNTITN